VSTDGRDGSGASLLVARELVSGANFSAVDFAALSVGIFATLG
jgi:hypothetical protein